MVDRAEDLEARLATYLVQGVNGGSILSGDGAVSKSALSCDATASVCNLFS